MLDDEEEKRLDAWLRSQSENATFFLDSMDELNLAFGQFDQALKRVKKAPENELGRTPIIITTRPVPIDQQLIVEYLPIPWPQEAQSTPNGPAIQAATPCAASRCTARHHEGS
jgi:hypothetical protein